MNHCKIFLLFSFTIINVTIGSIPELSPNTFLFCLKPELQPLTISLNRGKPSVGMAELDDYFQTHNVVRIEPWIKSATEMDRYGDIYLNRIYRIYINENSLGRTDQSISSIRDFPFILYAEPEYIRNPYYTPNDPSYSNQCSLESVKADLAWNYWDIESGEIPGDENILLASVDTGVDYTHPDLIANIWVNQGEIPDWAFEAPELNSNGDDYVSAIEINNYMLSEVGDLNGDGKINLRDALAGVNVSPFMDGFDNDGNEFDDDLIGWDASGISGTADNDPFPKEGSGVSNDGDWAHGTHVGGILAATTNNGIGMASSIFNGKILSVKCSRDGSDEDEPLINDGYDGITYAAKTGYFAGSRTIINCSWGGGGNNLFEEAVINIADSTYGAIIVAAAGNGDEDLIGQTEEYAKHYPASYHNVVSVCALSCNGNWGNWATYHPSVDLAAPGDNIYSTIIGGGYQTWDGSSMASPNAASVMGLVWSYYPAWSNDDLVAQVKLAADPFIYEKNPDYTDCNGNEGTYCLGTGMVDAYKAIGRGFAPNIETGPFIFTEIIGDSDGIINPGETGYMTISLKNSLGWADAENIQAVLISENPQVTIHDGNANYGNIIAGGSVYNINDTYKVSFSSDIKLGSVTIQLQVTGNSTGYDYSNLFEYTEITVSINQAGFPISTAELRASPLVIDLDGDGHKEIVIGDNNGFVHIYNADGSEVEDDTFPDFTGSNIWGSAAAADMDGDGLIDFVITSKSKHLYIFDQNGLKTDYDANKYLMGTPAIGNLDADSTDLEVVVGGYSSPASSNQIFAVNPDGSNVDGFPFSIGEKTKAGVALEDLDGNSKDDIIVGTDSNNLYLIYDDGTVAPGFPYITGDKIQAAPSVANIDGEKIIFFGSNDDNFYAIKSDGSLLFSILTGDKVLSSPSFLEEDGQLSIYFGSNDNKIYAVDDEGTALDGWPIEVNGSIVGSVVFSDLDGDGATEIVAATDMGDLLAFNLDGSYVNYFPISNTVPFSGSPMIADLDDDGDLEILAGSVSNLVVIDIKKQGVSKGYWSEFRGGFERRGSNSLSGCKDENFCNYSESAIWDDGSCSISNNICGDGSLGCDCNGVCNGTAVLDCDGICNGDTILDHCGECGGDGPDEGYNCDGTPLLLEEELLPNKYSLVNIYPNPFNPMTTIKYGLPDYVPVKIIVYDISGRQVAVLINNYESPGFHSVSWDASPYPSGLYFIQIKSYKFSETRKVLLIK